MSMRRLLVSALSLLLAAVAFGQQPNGLDLLLINGKVFTANPAAPWAEAVGIRGNRITAVGTTAAVLQTAGADTWLVDVGGRVVIPGINDAHTHVGARPPGVSLKLEGNDPTLDDVVAAIHEAATAAPEDQWIYGTVGERVLSDPKATRFTLDDVAPKRLVKLSAWSGHGVIFSTAALRAIEIGDRDPDPPFGRYRRTQDGTVDGRLDEYADLRAHRRLASLAGHAAAVASLGRLAVEAVEYGITSIQAMGNALPATDLATTLLPEIHVPVRWRIIRFPITLSEEDSPADFKELPRSPWPLVTVSGVKWILDGTPVERLAATNAPYADRPGWTGDLNLQPTDIDRALRRALESGDQPMFHAVGDRAIDQLLSAMERTAPAEQWQRFRVRIEHGEFLTRDRFERAKRLGIVNVQNPSHLTFPEIMTARFGARSASAEPLKSIVAAGIPLALGGDGPLNPFLNMMFAISHPNNPSEALTREQVVIAYTSGSAYAEFAEREKGQLKVGMLADVAVLSQDIFTVAADKLPATKSLFTIVDGKSPVAMLPSRPVFPR